VMTRPEPELFQRDLERGGAGAAEAGADDGQSHACSPVRACPRRCRPES
jgi:hypothetical protein